MIAINIALLPDPQLSKITENLNTQLTTQNQKITLNKGFYPHISLAMMIIKQSNIPKLKAQLPPNKIQITPTTFTTRTLPNGEKISSLSILKTQQLENYQQQILQIAKKFSENTKPNPAMYFQNQANPFALQYTENFLQSKSNPNNFDPHITLGFGQTPEHIQTPSQKFQASLQIFQLGNYCTCRKIL